jgi:hypothetical protein
MTELLHQNYIDIMKMPIARFYGLLKLKDKFDKDVAKIQKEELGK